MLIQTIVITKLVFYHRQYVMGPNAVIFPQLDFREVLREGQVHSMKNTPTL
jgi:hypothetical protein